MKNYLSERAGCLYRDTAGSWNVLDTLSNVIICNHLSATSRFCHVLNPSMGFDEILQVLQNFMRFHGALWRSMRFDEVSWCSCELKYTHWCQQRSNLLHSSLHKYWSTNILNIETKVLYNFALQSLPISCRFILGHVTNQVISTKVREISR
jgi:hypothetical protein